MAPYPAEWSRKSKLALKRWSAVWRVWSFWTAKCRMPFCSNCSPNSAPGRSSTTKTASPPRYAGPDFYRPLTARSVAAQRGLYQSRLGEMSHHCGRGGGLGFLARHLVLFESAVQGVARAGFAFLDFFVVLCVRHRVFGAGGTGV